MIAILIGISSGLLTILTFVLLKSIDKPTMYGLILTGIGFLYVGYTWTDLPSLVVTCLQAILFTVIAYFGVRKNLNYLIAGYFLHGTWDLLYDLFPQRQLIPPHYDLFCLSIDFTMGIYLLIFKYQEHTKKALS